MPDQNIYFMQKALELAKTSSNAGNIPVGAVIIKDGKIIAQGENNRHSKKNPIGHAEIIAIQNAAKYLKHWRLDGTTLYTTLEPCLMCIGAIINSRISHLVYGAKDKRFGAITLYNIAENNLTNHHFKVTSGILKEESLALLKEFFSSLRNK